MPTWDFGTVQFSEWDADGFLGIQPDPVPNGVDPGAAGLIELHHPYGTFSRPRDPDADGRGCSMLKMKWGSQRRIATLGTDPRTLELIPNGSKGTSYQFALTDNDELSFYEIDGETGTHSIYVPMGDSAHFVQIGEDTNGKAVLKLQHSEGMAVVLFEGGVIIHNAAGDGYVEVNASGVTVNGNLKLNGGLDVGGSGGLPLALADDLITWATGVNAALNSAGFPAPALPLTVATTLLKGK